VFAVFAVSARLMVPDGFLLYVCETWCAYRGCWGSVAEGKFGFVVECVTKLEKDT
jgi:hypothetical protein